MTATGPTATGPTATGVTRTEVTTGDGHAPATVRIQRGRWARHGGTVGVWLTRLVLMAALLGVWEWSADRWFDITFTSRPLEIWTRLTEWHQDGTLWSNTWVTVQEIVFGFALGSAAGAVLGFLLASAPVLYRVLDPFIMALYAIPKVALAPLFIVGSASACT
jgi:NitT/TauT family transport system permease protein